METALFISLIIFFYYFCRMQKRGLVYCIASLLIILGVVGHEVIPHHHHHHNVSNSTPSHQSCSNHNHSDSDCADDNQNQACSIFEYNPLGNVRHNVIDFSKKIECKNLSTFVLFNSLSSIVFVSWNRRVYTHYSILKKPSAFLKILSHRGPPEL